MWQRLQLYTAVWDHHVRLSIDAAYRSTVVHPQDQIPYSL